jgi:site-specific DNA-methyltransferase (adenine-specific)
VTEAIAKAEFSLRGYNPDVLTCIANLSNDEVFTPPAFANQMLDTLEVAWAEANEGKSLWTDSSVTFLDPFTKSGVFLREIVSRLTVGLAGEIPDLQERVDHILTKQVFGIGITALTSLLARRSVYCSKDATSSHSIATSFDRDWGNIWFERTEHTWAGDRCAYCGGSKSEYDRASDLETHAYALIHSIDAKALIKQTFGAKMQFDVIVGNPPYQLDDGGFGTSAAPIYQLFVQRALELEPRYAIFVTPSRWFAGGKGLDSYRQKMLGDHRMSCIVDYPKLFEAFPGVKIRGGISYFLWERDHDGPCTIQTMWDGKPVGDASSRYLDQFDVLVRRNEAVPILEKVRAMGEPSLEARISSRKPFGLATNFKGKPTGAGMHDAIQLFANQHMEWAERADISVNVDWIDKWKVLMTAVQGTSAAVETKFLSRPIIAPPGTACTETYLVAGCFSTEEEAEHFAEYLRSRFVRFLVSLRKSTQHATKDVYSFVPDLGADRAWVDDDLYSRYSLSEDEIAFVESQVAMHDDLPAVRDA